jgi:hypothetical protein
MAFAAIGPRLSPPVSLSAGLAAFPGPCVGHPFIEKGEKNNQISHVSILDAQSTSLSIVEHVRRHGPGLQSVSDQVDVSLPLSPGIYLSPCTKVLGEDQIKAKVFAFFDGKVRLVHVADQRHDAFRFQFILKKMK